MPPRDTDPRAASAVPPRSTARRDVGTALGLGLGLALLYAFTLQEHPYGDGELLVLMGEHGDWPINKLFYPWLFELVHRPLRLFADVTPETSLLVVSAGSAALAAALVHLAARAAGLGNAASASAALLLGLAPTTWFYATTVEVHAPNAAAGAIATLWAVRARRRGTLGRSALPPTLCLVALVGTHPTGALWGPALAAPLVGRLLQRRAPRGVVVSAFLLAAFTWALVRTSHRGLYANYGLEELPYSWRPGQLWRTLGTGAALLVPAGVAGLVVGARGCTRAAGLGALLLVSFVGPLPVIPIEERGGLYASLLPALALGAAFAFQALPRRVRWLAPACVLVQGLLGHLAIQDYQDRFVEPEWLAPLEREAGERILVLTATAEEAGAFERFASSPFTLARPLPLIVAEDEDWLRPDGIVLQVRRRGMRVAVLRTVHELEHEAVAEYLRALERRLGPPVAGAHPAYELFPTAPPDGAAR